MTESEHKDRTLETYDVAIVGGGPAGLAAAMYLSRFLRSVIVFHTGDARARLIASTSNCPGFPEGIAGEELLRRLTAQAKLSGAKIVEAGVQYIAREPDGFHIVGTDRRVRSRYVILATGIVDKAPAIPDLQDAIADGLVRLCPVCDAYEARGKRIAVVGPERLALSEAIFLKDYSRQVVMLFNYPHDVSDAVRRQALQAGIEIDDGVDNLVRHENLFKIISTDNRPAGQVDVLYVAMGCDVRSELAEIVGAERDVDGYILVGDHMRTTIPDLYAIGDVAKALNQISVGFGHGAAAAADIHKRMRDAGSTSASRMK